MCDNGKIEELKDRFFTRLNPFVIVHAIEHVMDDKQPRAKTRAQRRLRLLMAHASIS